MTIQVGEFHWRDGWYFSRLPDGAVRMQNRNSDGRILEALIPAPEWASIVCSVSIGGEGNGRWIEAQKFHGQYVTPRESFTVTVGGRLYHFRWGEHWPDYPLGWLSNDRLVFVTMHGTENYSVEHADPSGAKGFYFCSENHKTKEEAARAGVKAYAKRWAIEHAR